MATKKNRHEKANPHYNFLVSWQPPEARVKGEMKSGTSNVSQKLSNAKKADILAQESKIKATKKDLLKSLILVSFVLILELVVYLARTKLL